MKREGLGELILSSQETMYRVAKTLLPQDEDCADAIQEAIVKAFAGLHTLRSDRYAKTWLIRIVINECYAILRKRRNLVSLEEHPWEAPAVSAREEYSELYEAISRLDEHTRLAVALYYLEGYSVRETAAVLDVTENVVKKRLMRARQQLRADLMEEIV